MGLYPIFYLGTVGIGSLASLMFGPIYGLLTYVFVYFNIPSNHWWGSQVPDLRWSLLSAAVLIVSCFLHSDQLSTVRLAGSRPLHFLVVLLVLMALLVPFAVSPTAASRLYDFFRLVVISFLIVKVIANRSHLRYVLYVFLAEMGYLGYLARHYFTGVRLEGIGPTDASDANMFAALLITGIPLLAFFIVRGKIYERLLALPVLALVLDALVMTRSRGGFLALAVSWVVMLFSFDAKYRKRMFAASVAAGLMFLVLIDPGYLSRLQSLENPLENSAGRSEIWQYSIRMIKDHPLGTGGEGFLYLSPLYMPESLLSSQVGGRVAHNTYLQVTVEQGVLGLLFYLGFLLSTYKSLRSAVRIRTSAGDVDGGLLAKFLLASLTGILVAGLFVDRLYSEVLYWICALSVVCDHLIRQESGVGDPTTQDLESRVAPSWKSTAY